MKDIFIATIFIIYGLLSINRKSYQKLVRLQNQWRGTETKITERTFQYGKIIGVLFIIMGLIILRF